MNNAINHRNMRILLILILSIFSLMFCFDTHTKNVLAGQTYTPKVTIQSKTVHRGQTFSVDVDLSDNEGLIDLFLILDYDNTAMTLKNIIQGDALGSLKLTKQGNGQYIEDENDYDYSIKPMNLLWDGKTVDTTNGKILTLIFDSFIDAPMGEYEISMTYDKQNTNSAYKTPIDIEITNGIINLIAGEFKAIYRDYDGTILYQKDYNADDIPAYPDTLPNPSREADEEYSYEFKGWKGVISDDINILIFEADYILTPKVYTVFYYVDGANDHEPDGVIDEADYFGARDFDFNAFIELPDTPFKQYYIFNGWYTDINYTKVLNFVKMPSHDIRLYGYFAYEVRETNIPLLKLETKQLSTSSVIVSANIVRNTGLNGLVLTLDYDNTVLKLRSFSQSEAFSSMIFDTTNIEKLNEPNFKFFFEQESNSYDTGEFLIMYFDIIKSQEGIYNVTFTYDYHHDATYKDSAGELKYTKLEIIGTEVPIGEIFHWNEDLGGGRSVDVTSDDGKPINVMLSVELVTEKIYIEQEKIEQVVGKKMYLQSAYSIKLIQNNVEIEPQTTLTIRIKLTYYEQQCKKLKFYYYNNDNDLEEHEFTVEGNELVFKTNHLSCWTIFGDYNKNKGFESDSKVVTLIMYPILLAITTMTYAFIQKGKVTKLKNKNLNKEAHDE
jgi:hypothetical protein